MSRLTRDGTAEPVSRDQILRHARGQGNIIFPVQLTTSRIGNLTASSNVSGTGFNRDVPIKIPKFNRHVPIKILNCNRHVPIKAM